jgi:hypothetical protein
VVIRDQEAAAMSREAQPADDITCTETDAPVPGLKGTAPRITIGQLAGT